VGDRVAMLQHAYYSVISPEGCAGILWKVATETTKPKAADALSLTAADLQNLKVIDHVIAEPVGGAHRNPRDAGNALKGYLTKQLRELGSLAAPQLIQARYEKFRGMGVLA
jgi:acetyl-CoA carboxylase carboxyl transferase subunit alpha